MPLKEINSDYQDNSNQHAIVFSETIGIQDLNNDVTINGVPINDFLSNYGFSEVDEVEVIWIGK